MLGFAPKQATTTNIYDIKETGESKMKKNKEIRKMLAKFSKVKTMPCPVCETDMPITEDGSLFCGHLMLIEKETDHYILVWNHPDTLPETGCPICGDEMKDIGIFKWIFTRKEEGVERVLCNKSGKYGHYICVSKSWYQKNRKKQT